VAVNNAGTEGTPGPVTEQSAESYAATFDTSVLGTLLSMKHELRVMLAQGHPKRSLRPSCLSLPTRRLSLRVHPSPSMAENWLADLFGR